MKFILIIMLTIFSSNFVLAETNTEAPSDKVFLTEERKAKLNIFKNKLFSYKDRAAKYMEEKNVKPKLNAYKEKALKYIEGFDNSEIKEYSDNKLTEI